MKPDPSPHPGYLEQTISHRRIAADPGSALGNSFLSPVRVTGVEQHDACTPQSVFGSGLQRLARRRRHRAPSHTPAPARQARTSEEGSGTAAKPPMMYVKPP